MLDAKLSTSGIATFARIVDGGAGHTLAIMELHSMPITIPP
jgi:hypothetical protein